MGLRVWYVSATGRQFSSRWMMVVDPVIQKIRQRRPSLRVSRQDQGHWMAVPTCYGSAAGPPCARIDLFKEYVGLDIQKMYRPDRPDTALDGSVDLGLFTDGVREMHEGRKGRLVSG